MSDPPHSARPPHGPALGVPLALARAQAPGPGVRPVFRRGHLRGRLRVELYRPRETTPDRDERYVPDPVTTTYTCDGEQRAFAAGDLLFAAHRQDLKHGMNITAHHFSKELS